ncbi:uncharacterized protein LOC132057831 [Lycium ferocissimum]|uniref:uncharacterized protein LOC132057831 n=1 Tax=Lycium ferocissimum TaxID=112874 RepID=UPI0028164443|nr:uncharacterized protein LOC132057831 [Lycium ferocissimum]
MGELDLVCDRLDVPVHMCTSVGDLTVVDRVYRSRLVTFMGYDTWEKKLYAKFYKCEFWLDSMIFMSHVVLKDGIMVYPKKIEAVRDWARPTSVAEIRSFEVPFQWPDAREESFQNLKTLLTTSPILALPVEVRVLACVKVRPSLLEQIRAQQFDDAKLCMIRDKVLSGEAKEAMLDDEGVLRIKGHVCVSHVGGLIHLILEEAHSSRYSIHPREIKIYRNLRQHY